MNPINDIEAPEIPQRTDWEQFTNKLFGYDEWAEAYKKRHYENRLAQHDCHISPEDSCKCQEYGTN